MNIEDIKNNFIVLLRDRYDAKQYRDKDYSPQLVDLWPDSDTDIIIGKKVLGELGFNGEVFCEVICPALERDGVLESYHKFYVDEEEYMEDFPYEFKVNKRKLFEGSGREYPDVSSISYKQEERVLMVNDTKIKITGPAQHVILSIIFNDFENEVRGEGVFFDEIVEKDDSTDSYKNGSKRVENALRQVNNAVRMQGFHIVFDLKGKKVKLDHS